MLVRFDSKVGQVLMMGDSALALLKKMGHSGTVPSAILAADIPDAVRRLRAALDSMPAELPPEDEEERREFVPLARRAVPLLDLLERSARAAVDVTWAATR